MTDLFTLVPPPGRTNTTPLFDDHPGDHNVLVDAINSLADSVDAISTSANYRTYDTVADRNADTSAHVEGMLSWAASERILAVYHGEWEVLVMPFIAFTPRLFIGTIELAPIGPPPAYQSGYRLNYGVVEFSVGHRFGELPDSDPTDVVYVMPPITPDGQGGFGTAYLVDITGVGAVGGMGGVYNPTQLSIVMPGTQGLLQRGHMGGAGGQVDVFMNGTYTTATYALP